MVPYLEKWISTLKFGAELTVVKSSLWQDYQVAAQRWAENDTQTSNMAASKQRFFKVI